jgi:hypothetical protein
MGHNLTVFDDDWRVNASGNALPDSWARDVIATLDQDGGTYLDTLSLWFGRFPLTSQRHRWTLKTRLESLATVDHLGAVNELSWYEFMRHEKMEASPLPPVDLPRPDFKVTAPVDLFVEVSTLNVSGAERRALQSTGGVDLNHMETLRRLLRKATDEKTAQIEHAASEHLPCLLVLFDYTFWSGLATDYCRFLATALLGEPGAFPQLTVALSAIAYVERKIVAGRIAISLRRSAIYHNPAASHPLAPDILNVLRKFGRTTGEIEPASHEDWLWLS